VSGEQVAELEMVTRALVGITRQSLEVLGGAVSLPQFRLLLVAATAGRATSSQLAREAAVPASSVTRVSESSLRAEHLGDFTLQPRSLLITGVALAVGGAGAVAS
jgi:hypothetical protein